MIEIVANEREILTELSEITNASIIGIDGFKGSGKSTLSYYLGHHLRKNVLNIDDFVINNKGTYVPSIKWNELKNSINSLQNVVIEGVCLLKIVDTLNIKLDYIIYCKELSKDTRLWHQGFFLPFVVSNP